MKICFQSAKINHPDDRQILASLDKTIKNVTQDMEKYRFGQAAEKLYAFFWHESCDIYLEQAKKRPYNESRPKKMGRSFDGF
jgi:valyl-tRNA synthetase